MSLDQTVVVPDRCRHECCRPEEASVVYSTGLLSYIPVLKRLNEREASVVDTCQLVVCVH